MTREQLIESAITKIAKKVINEGKLLATAPTEERIIKLISDYYYGSTITLVPEDGNPNRFAVHNKKGLINGVVVILQGNKYRFEQI